VENLKTNTKIYGPITKRNHLRNQKGTTAFNQVDELVVKFLDLSAGMDDFSVMSALVVIGAATLFNDHPITDSR
jgi:hypothetical protein